MKTAFIPVPTALVLVLVTSFGWAQQSETPEPVVQRVSLFKNGLVIVQEEVTLQEDGAFTWVRPPQFLHGTVWLDTEHPVRLETRMVEAPVEPENIQPAPTTSGNWQESLVGKTVGIRLRHATADTIYHTKGTVMSLQDDENGLHAPGYLLIQTGRGLEFVGLEDVVSVTVLGVTDPEDLQVPETEKQMEEVHALHLHFPETSAAELPDKITLTYMARGMTWAPAYRVDIQEEKTLRIAQSATIRNELRDFSGATVDLISGFPHMEFAEVEGLLSARLDTPANRGRLVIPQDSILTQFFRQLGRDNASITSNVVRQAVRVSGMGLAPMIASEEGTVLASGQDIHYQTLEDVSVDKGQSLRIDLASASADAETYVEWVIPPFQEPDTRHTQNEQEERFEPWEMLRFTNPFKHPLTTAPALIFQEGQFAGQSVMTWANPGQAATVRINKALSLITSHQEIEHLDRRERLEMHRRHYEKLFIDSTFTLQNTRSEPVSIVVHHSLDGKIVEAEGEPKSIALPTARDSVNPRNRLTWELQLEPGERREMTFSYSTLARR